MQSTSKSPISPETVSQAGAGALLAAVGVVELWLAFAAAEWWYRCGASMVAAVGVALLARAVAEIAPPLGLDLARRVPRWESAAPAKPARIVPAD